MDIVKQKQVLIKKYCPLKGKIVLLALLIMVKRKGIGAPSVISKWECKELCENAISCPIIEGLERGF